jgi:hypothetical protein
MLGGCTGERSVSMSSETSGPSACPPAVPRARFARWFRPLPQIVRGGGR